MLRVDYIKMTLVLQKPKSKAEWLQSAVLINLKTHFKIKTYFKWLQNNRASPTESHLGSSQKANQDPWWLHGELQVKALSNWILHLHRYSPLPGRLGPDCWLSKRRFPSFCFFPQLQNRDRNYESCFDSVTYMNVLLWGRTKFVNKWIVVHRNLCCMFIMEWQLFFRSLWKAKIPLP